MKFKKTALTLLFLLIIFSVAAIGTVHADVINGTKGLQPTAMPILNLLYFIFWNIVFEILFFKTLVPTKKALSTASIVNIVSYPIFLLVFKNTGSSALGEVFVIVIEALLAIKLLSNTGISKKKIMLVCVVANGFSAIVGSLILFAGGFFWEIVVKANNGSAIQNSPTKFF